MSIKSMGLFWEKAEAESLTQYGIQCTPDGLGFNADVPEEAQQQAWELFHEVEAEELAKDDSE